MIATPTTSSTGLWNRRTLALLASSSLAGFGGWIDFLAILTLAAYAYQANAFVMALVSALFLVPAMLLGPRVGRWLDRSSPGALILAALALRTLATALLMLQPSLWVFCVLVGLRSAFTVPVDPAFNVLVSRVVASDQVPRYFGLLGLLRNGSKIAAPVLGTTIASLYGEGMALGLSVGMTIVAMVVAAGVVFGTSKPAQDTAATIPAAAGPASSQGAPAGSPARPPTSPLLAQLLFTVTVFAFMVFFVNNQLPILLRDGGFDKALLGVLVSSSGAGGILAAMYMMRNNAAVLAEDPMLATTVSVLAIAACFVLLGLAFLLPLSLATYAAGAIFFCTGIFASIEAIRSNTVVVQQFPDQVGEVSGTIQSYTSAAMLAAPWLAAAVIPHVSLPLLLIGDGVLGFIALALVAARFRALAGRATGGADDAVIAAPPQTPA